jgi:hypothetical protein
MISKLLFSLFTCTLLALASADAQTTVGAIPPDFKRDEGILIIIKPEKKSALPGFEKNIDKHFKKYYSGKYEIATEKEVESESRFQDKKIYKFSLKHEIRDELVQRTGADGRMKTDVKHHARFNFYDRESGTEYGSFAEGRSDDETLERIAKMLEGTYK